MWRQGIILSPWQFHQQGSPHYTESCSPDKPDNSLVLEFMLLLPPLVRKTAPSTITCRDSVPLGSFSFHIIFSSKPSLVSHIHTPFAPQPLIAVITLSPGF